MGANLKRKEARKRKFGQDSEHLLDDNIRLDFEGSSAEELPRKKSKQAPSPPFPLEKTPAASKAAAGKVAAIDKSTEQEETEKAAIQKAQRFIVFIGPSTLFKHPWLGRLMAFC